MWKKFKSIVEHIEIGESILPGIPKWIKEKGFRNVLLVADHNTFRVLGQSVSAQLGQTDLAHRTVVLSPPATVKTAGSGAATAGATVSQDLVADEFSVGQLTCAFTPDIDLILGVGSGTINDLCKFVGHRVGRPCAIAGTAPSMDGYAAAGAAMTLNGMKVTPQTQCPSAIFCDLDILKQAPMPMIAAGLGDILGKINALADWKLSHLLTGEPMPADIARLVEDAVQSCTDNAQKAALRDAGAVRSITEGLILSGIAMSLYGDSRPASGAEHHLAHYWEMRFVAENKPPVFHGHKVGVATLCALSLWKSLPQRPLAPPLENRAAILELIKKAYGPAAAALLPVPNPNISYEKIITHWPEILSIAASLPDPSAISGLLAFTGGPVSTDAIGVSPQLLQESILLARERKKTYTILQLRGDLGL